MARPFSSATGQRQPRVARPAGVPSPSPRKTSLSSERLHEAYSLLLGKLSLQVLHRISCERGLNDEQIAKYGYKSMPSGPGRAKIAAELARLWAMTLPKCRASPLSTASRAFAAQWHSHPRPQHEWRNHCYYDSCRRRLGPLRSTRPFVTKCGGTGPGAARRHVPITIPAPATKVRLTEGHLKADVINALDPTTPTVSCPGVSMYQKGVDAAKELGRDDRYGVRH